MKKCIVAFGFLSLFAFYTPAEAEVINYWDYWSNKAATESQYQANTPSIWGRSRYSRPRYSSSRVNSTPRTTTRTTTSTSTNTGTSRSRWMQYLRTKYANRLGNRTTSTTSSAATTRTTISRDGVRATVTPITLRQDINDITAAPVDLFRIGLSHNASGSDYTEAVNIDEMRFQITDNTGIVSSFDDFSLVTEDQEFDFDSQGFVTLKFKNLRLARSEDRALDISIKVEDPDNFPRLPGSFRVKVTGVTAYREFSQASVPVQLSGRTASDYVVLNPNARVTGGGTSVANIIGSQTVVGRPLGGGEEAFVLTLSLSASYDDFLLEELSVTNQFGSNADQLVREIRLVDLSNGAVLDTTRFVGGRATFDLPNNQQLLIPRNNRAKIGLEVQIVSSPNSDNLDNRLRLLIDSDDVQIFGIGAGREVPNSQKNLSSVDSQTFTISSATLAAKGGIAFSSNQPTFFTTGSLNQVARFQVVNAGGRDVSFGRFTLQVVPNGTAFATGGAADFQLVELFNGVTEFPRFTTTNVAGNTITFDADSEVYIDAGQTREFALKVALNNTGGNNDSDGVSVVILGDSTLQKGTLASVRGSGANFIWSDHSGAPHTSTSADWLSGFQFSGVPTNAFVNTRR